jgi:hypothetical protein
MPPDLLAQFPIAEEAIEALGLVLWPMVEWEADDAIAAAATLWAGDPEVTRIVVCTPDKDMAQLVDDERIVLWDRRRRIVYDDAAVRVKWGVPPASIPDWLALVGDASDGYPGIPGYGAKTAAALLSRYGHLEDVPIKGSSWHLDGVRNQVGLAQVLRERLAEAMLYRDLARLRTAADGWARPGPAGRRSATSGASTGCAPARTAGSRAEGGAEAQLTSLSSSPWCAAGAARTPIERGGRARSNQVPPARSVTVAPARSAIRPAAATSHAERPPCWTNASNRPFAT